MPSEVKRISTETYFEVRFSLLKTFPGKFVQELSSAEFFL